MSRKNVQEIQVGESLIKISNCEKPLGIKFDYELAFDNNVNNLCKKTNNKLRALFRATAYVNIEKKELLRNSFFNAQFNYCPVIWMLQSHYNNNKIKHLYDSRIRLFYCDRILSNKELLEKDELVSTHHTKNTRSCNRTV